MKEAWAVKPKDISADQIACTHYADIVIIGAGHAGTCAARAAAEAGANVFVLEQQERDKQWVLGIGEIGHINSRWQQEHGIPAVDIDTFVNDWQLRTGNRSLFPLIKTYALHCGETFDWFIEPLTQEEKDSIHPMLTPASPNMPEALNGLHAWPGTPNMGMALQTKAVKANQRLAEEHGAVFFFSTRAMQLEQAADGRVTGVFAKSADGTIHLYRAARGVILAAGDYSRNAEMCRYLLTEAADLTEEGSDFTGHGWDGSGIRMGLWAGGRLEPRSHAAMGGNYSFPGFGLIGSTPVLRVNKHGKRYSDEAFGTHILAALPGAHQPNGVLWSVFDDDIHRQLTFQSPCHGMMDYTDAKERERFENALENAKKHKNQIVLDKDRAGESRPLYCADTLEKLAELMFEHETERRTFLGEIKRYNELCYQKHDDDFGKDPRLMQPVEKAPFYASGTVKDSHRPGGQSLKILVTVSGLEINENQQVLNRDFEPISGLYATGNCSGRRFGVQYTTSMPGQSISIAQTLGREVGLYLARNQEDK